jgi:hypothetical protein
LIILHDKDMTPPLFFELLLFDQHCQLRIDKYYGRRGSWLKALRAAAFERALVSPARGCGS